MSTQTQRTKRNVILPHWSRSACEWTLGSELQIGDTLYQNSYAQPRYLDECLQPDLWRATINGGPHGYGKAIPNQLVEVDPERWYVVRRAGQL